MSCSSRGPRQKTLVVESRVSKVAGGGSVEWKRMEMLRFKHRRYDVCVLCGWRSSMIGV